MPRTGSSSSAPTRLLAVVTVVAVIALLYYAQEFLIPFALAILISFLLAPLVSRFEKWGLSRVAAVVLVSFVAFSVVGGLGFVVARQLSALLTELPRYRENIHDKVVAIRGQ